MREYIISKDDASQRLNKYLRRLLPRASEGFLYKMLRKKNITLNGKKATGKEIICQEDVVRIYFSEDTFLIFSADIDNSHEFKRLSAIEPDIDIIHEEDDFLLLNKPAGLLTQQSKKGDITLNELMLAYLIRQGTLDLPGFIHFRPSVMNRLDRGTSGIVIASKTLRGAGFISDAISSHSIKKEYAALVHGYFREEGLCKKWLVKDEKKNKVTLHDEQIDGAVCVKTEFSVIKYLDGMSHVRAVLITGKSHQIRSQLAYLGHPVVFDRKYGDPGLDGRCHITTKYPGQLLHAGRITLPDGRFFEAPLPDVFREAGY